MRRPELRDPDRPADGDATRDAVPDELERLTRRGVRSSRRRHRGSARSVPESPTVISHAASASCTVFDDRRQGLRGRLPDEQASLVPAAGRPGTATTSGFERGQAAGTTAPVIHEWTARAAQAGEVGGHRAVADARDDERACPAGTGRRPTWRPAVGVRMSKPPLTASTGTFGSGPAPSGAPPAGLGQPRQKSALPKRCRPRAERAAGCRRGSAAIAACSSAGRSAGRSVGRPRERPVVAHRRRVEAPSSARSTARPSRRCSGRRARRSGCMLPFRAAFTTAGSSAARPGFRSASRTSESRSTPSTCTALARPFASVALPWSGFAASLFASATTSAGEVAGRALQPPSEQKRASVPGRALQDVR